MFRASTIYQDVSIIDDLNCFKIPYTDEVLTIDGWKKVKDLSLQDSLVNDDEIGHIKDIKVENIFLMIVPFVCLFFLITMPTFKNHDEYYHK